MQNIDETPDTITYGSLVTACAKEAQPGRAFEVFKALQEADQTAGCISCNSLMTIFAKEGNVGMVMEAFALMQEAGNAPSVITYKTFLVGCANGGRTDKMQEIFGSMQEIGLSKGSYILHRALMEAYRFAGDVVGAERVRQIVRNDALINTLAPSATAGNADNAREYENRVSSPAQEDSLAAFAQELTRRTACMPQLRALPFDFTRRASSEHSMLVCVRMQRRKLC